MALEQKLENLEGNLKVAYKQAVPGTLLHADQLNQARMTDATLRNKWYYTPDGEVYSVDDGVETWRVTREASNPVLNHIDEAFPQLLSTGNYKVSETDFAAVKAAADTLTVKIADLMLQGDNSEYGFIQVRTKDGLVWTGKKDWRGREVYESANATQNAVINRFGFTQEYLGLLHDRKKNEIRDIEVIRIFALKPDYVKEAAKDGPMGRASWLYYFYSSSIFYADGHSISNDGRLRGVRREVIAEGDALKNKVPCAPQEVRLATMDEIRKYSAPFVPELLRAQYEAGLNSLGKVYKL